MDCSGCDAHCCKNTALSLTMEEYLRIKKQFPGIKGKMFGGKAVIIAPPCPMLGEDNKCQVYDIRPSVCRAYPGANIIRPELGIVCIGVNTVCPRFMQIVKDDKDRVDYYNEGIAMYLDVTSLGIPPERMKEMNKHIEKINAGVNIKEVNPLLFYNVIPINLYLYRVNELKKERKE